MQNKKILALFLGGCFCIATGLILGNYQNNQTPSQPYKKSASSLITPSIAQTITQESSIRDTSQNISDKKIYKVVKVVDGDTIDVMINGLVTRIRLIGVDTPEIVDPRKPVQCFAKQASDKVRETLTNTSVYLEPDPTQGEFDKYHRLLRFVFLENGTNFNKQIISEGFAHEYTFENNPYRYQKEFKEAESQARKQKLGLWNAC